MKNIQYMFQIGKWHTAVKVSVLFFLAILILTPLLFNEKPIICSYKDRIYAPVFFSSYGSPLWEDVKELTDWSQLSYDWSLFPVIRYADQSMDAKYGVYTNPFSNGSRGLHILGTDGLSRDVLSGIFYGARRALMLGFLSVCIALIPGVSIGLSAGYLKNTGYKNSKLIFGLLICILCLMLYVSTWYTLNPIFKVLFWSCVVGLFLFAIFKSETVYFPFDFFGLRLIEITRSFPTLFLLLALMQIVLRLNIWWTSVIIGLLFTSTIVKYTRAAVLKYRESHFVHAAKAMGKKNWTILLQEILPNVIPTILTTAIFGIAAAVSLEAVIQFLGIGGEAGIVSLGAMLSDARNHFSAWWLVLFPGLMLAWILFTCQKIGDYISASHQQSFQ